MLEFPKGLEKDYVILRYAIVAQGANRLSVQNQLIELGQLLGSEINGNHWLALLNDIINIQNNPYPDSVISGIRKSYTKKNREKETEQLNKEEYFFFKDILTKDVQSKAQEIMKNATAFYNSGHFKRYNQAFYRYVRNLKEVNDYDLDEMIARHFVVSVILKQYSECKENLQFIMKNPHLYDYNIYIFLINLIEGNFNDAVKNILTIRKNIPEMFFEKIFKEEEIALYMVIILLLNFNENLYREVLTQNEYLVYKLNELHPKIFEILNLYNNCEYEKVLAEIERLKKDKFHKDPIFCTISDSLEKNIKINILKEILKISSAVEIKYLENLLKMNNIEIEKLIIDLIDNHSYNIVIDDITGIIYFKNKSEIDNTLQQCLKTSQKNLAKIFDFTLRYTLEGKVSTKNLSMEGIEPETLDEKYFSEDYKRKYGGWGYVGGL